MNTKFIDFSNKFHSSPGLFDYEHNSTKNYIHGSNINNSFNYYPLNNLKTKNFILNHSYQNIDICLFKIINYNNRPFLLFNLYKNTNNELHWPIIDNFNNINYNFNNFNNINDISQQILIQLQKIYTHLKYTGYYLFNNRILLCFYYDTTHSIDYINVINNLYWISISEILNYKKYLNYNISNNIIKFFLCNSKFIYLKNKKNQNLDIPIIGYFGSNYKLINYISKYGNLKQNINSSFGSCYYFGNYVLSMNYIVFSKSKNIHKYGLIRYAIFLDKVKFILHDNYISKFDWYSYDSICINKYNKYNLCETKYIIKNYNNFIPLSIYYMNL